MCGRRRSAIKTKCQATTPPLLLTLHTASHTQAYIRACAAHTYTAPSPASVQAVQYNIQVGMHVCKLRNLSAYL
jgi:hypothetical protein